ncbi:MAG: hypothetical protein RR014_04960, partial [Bilophila sp.]
QPFRGFMRALPFVKLSPCGNITVLITDVPLSPAERARVAAELIAPGHLAAEQAGFVDTRPPLPRMDMMGGEFCLNASRALAVHLLREGRLRPQEAALEAASAQKSTPQTTNLYGWHEGMASLSGVDTPLLVQARRLAPAATRQGSPNENRFEAAVVLDLPDKPELCLADAGIWLVRLPGIAHLVLDAQQHPLPRLSASGATCGTSAEESGIAATTRLLTRFGLLEEDAAGCIWLQNTAEAATPHTKDHPTGQGITPFVRVRATNTIYAETACGSGTLAAAMVCWQNEEACPLALRQPGGEALTVSPARSAYANGWAVRVTGSVQVLAQGDVFVDCLD